MGKKADKTEKEPRIKIADDPARLSAAARRAFDALAGRRLCRQFVHDERFAGAAYWIEPTGRGVDRAAAEELIRKGRVRPATDSLFADIAQSFEVCA